MGLVQEIGATLGLCDEVGRGPWVVIWIFCVEGDMVKAVMWGLRYVAAVSRGIVSGCMVMGATVSISLV